MISIIIIGFGIKCWKRYKNSKNKVCDEYKYQHKHQHNHHCNNQNICLIKRESMYLKMVNNKKLNNNKFIKRSLYQQLLDKKTKNQ